MTMKTNQFLVFSEFTDPCHHPKLTKERAEEHTGPLYFITKDPRPIMQTIRGNKERSIVHVTITGLGGTPCEPNVPLSKDLKESVRELSSLLGNKLTIRCDPIIFGANDTKISDIIREFSFCKQFRISYCSLYPFIRPRLAKLGIKTPDSFRYYQLPIKKHSAEIAKTAEECGATISYCAPLPEIAKVLHKSISHDPCISSEAYKATGFPPLQATRTQRQQCSCLAKTEGLPEFKSCKHGCVYCYFSK